MKRNLISTRAILSVVASIDTSFASASRLSDDNVKWTKEKKKNKNDLNAKNEHNYL